MSEEIARKLLNSQAVRSLAAESSTAAAFESAGWNVTHSFFYRDLQTGKSREVDVLASMAWHRPPNIAAVIRLNVVAECKSNAAYHIVASASQRSAVTASLDRFWILDTDSFAKIMTAVAEVGIDPPTKVAIRKAVLDATLGADEQPIEVRPPDVAPVASGFTETNSGNEKELDNSVLWRATLTLTSAIASLKAARLADSTNQLHILAVVDELMGDDPTAKIRDHLITAGRSRDFFHPVIFIDSPLWILRDGTLEQQETLRLRFGSAWDTVLPWVDVVAASSTDAFVSRVTKFYAESLRRQQLVRSTWML